MLKQQSYQAWLAEDAGLQDFQDFPATSPSQYRGESWRHKIPGFEVKERFTKMGQTGGFWISEKTTSQKSDWSTFTNQFPA